MLFLAALTMTLLGILAKRWYGKEINLLTVLVYFSHSTNCNLNRLVMPENLITPLTLAAILLYEQYKERKEYLMWIIAFFNYDCSAFEVTGLILPATIIAYMLTQKPKRTEKETAKGLQSTSFFLSPHQCLP